MKKLIIILTVLLTIGCVKQVVYNGNNYTVAHYNQKELNATQTAIKKTYKFFEDQGIKVDNHHDIQWVYNVEKHTKLRASGGKIIGLYIKRPDKIYIKRYFYKWGSPYQRKVALMAHELTHDILYQLGVHDRGEHEYLAAIVEFMMYPESIRKTLLKKTHYKPKYWSVKEYFDYGWEWQVAAYRHYLEDGGKRLRRIINVDNLNITIG